MTGVANISICVPKFIIISKSLYLIAKEQINIPSAKIIIDKCKRNKGKNKQVTEICDSKPEKKYHIYTNNIKINWNRK